MTKEQLETQLTEMWDAVSRVGGPDHDLAVNEANHIEQKLRLQFDIEERVRNAAPDLLEALEGLTQYFAFMFKDPKFREYTKAIAAINKAKGL